MKRFALLVLSIIAINTYSQNNIYSVDTFKIESEILNENRSFILYKPVILKQTEPVKFLYILEGEASNYIYQELQNRFKDTISDLVVVGIMNPERRRDMLYINGANTFLDFIKSELIPFTEKDYNVKTRILYGHSFCGSFTVYALINKPEYFDCYLASSPIPLITMVETEHYTKLDSLITDKIRFYFSSGSKDMKQVRKCTAILRDNLEGTKFRNLDWQFKIFEGKNHSDIYMDALFWGLTLLMQE